MGAISLQDARDDLRFIIGGYTVTELSDPLVDRWLRWAVLHIARPAIYEHRELFTNGTFTLVTSDRDYAFSAFGTSTDNVQAVSLVMNETRGQRLVRQSLRQMEERARSGAAALLEGRPTHYTLAGSTLYVTPTPNSTHNGDIVRVWFWRKPAALDVAPAHELAEDWDEVMIAGATWRAFRYLNLQDRAELAKVEFGQLANEVADRLRADMREDMADSGFDVQMVDYQQESF
jgi:hypothetical protein